MHAKAEMLAMEQRLADVTALINKKNPSLLTALDKAAFEASQKQRSALPVKHNKEVSISEAQSLNNSVNHGPASGKQQVGSLVSLKKK